MTSRKHPDFSGSEYVKVFHGTVCYQKLCRTFAVLCTSALICINNVCVIQSNNQGLGDFVYLHYKTQVRFLFVSLSTLSSETFSLLVSLSGAGQSLWPLEIDKVSRTKRILGGTEKLPTLEVKPGPRGNWAEHLPSSSSPSCRCSGRELQL